MYCITFYMCDGSKYVIGGVGAGAYGLLRDKTDMDYFWSLKIISNL